MRKVSLILGTLAAAAILVVPAAAQQPAQEKTPAPPEMQAPHPGPEMDRLKFLLGKWRYKEVDEKTPLAPNGGSGAGTYVAALGPGGFSQIADFEGDGPEGPIKGHEVITWDPGENAYKS